MQTPDVARMFVDSCEKLSVATMAAAWTIYANGDVDEKDGESDK
jgi:hypothetical protein